jgi:hypothetical protein
MYGRSGSLSLLRARVEGRKGGADCQTVTERSAAAWQLTTPRNSLTESRGVQRNSGGHRWKIHRAVGCVQPLMMQSNRQKQKNTQF